MELLSGDRIEALGAYLLSISEKRKKIISMEQFIEEYTEQVDLLQWNVEIYERFIHEFKSKEETHSLLKDKMKAEMKRNRIQIDCLKEDMNQCRELVKQSCFFFEDSIQKLGKVVEVLIRESKEAENSFKQKVKTTWQEKNDLVLLLNERNEKVSAQDLKLKNLQDDLDNIKQENEAFKVEMQRGDTFSENLKGNLKRKAREIELLRVELEETKGTFSLQRNDLQKQFQELTFYQSEMKKKLESCQIENSQWISQLDELRVNQEELMNQVESQKNKAQLLQKKLDDSSIEAARWKQEAELHQMKIIQKEKEIKLLNEKLHRDHTDSLQIHKLEEIISISNHRLSSLENENNNLKKRNNDIEREMQKNSIISERYLLQQKDYEKEKEDLVENCRRKEISFEDSKKLFQTEITTLTSKLEQLQNTIANKNKEIAEETEVSPQHIHHLLCNKVDSHKISELEEKYLQLEKQLEVFREMEKRLEYEVSEAKKKEIDLKEQFVNEKMNSSQLREQLLLSEKNFKNELNLCSSRLKTKVALRVERAKARICEDVRLDLKRKHTEEIQIAEKQWRLKLDSALSEKTDVQTLKRKNSQYKAEIKRLETASKSNVQQIKSLSKRIIDLERELESATNHTISSSKALVVVPQKQSSESMFFDDMSFSSRNENSNEGEESTELAEVEGNMLLEMGIMKWKEMREAMDLHVQKVSNNNKRRYKK
eukprot:TRINITY_DN4200_c0_g1_i1.p1 TRINITY_DN4200_c0_g1~~TRINITY_DN4200_c0_g1_i1.p1  ORF type:complete len:712 (-),score=230.91 TRINITY_DN4200_c0_g1_i1:74-2209(-)